MPDKLEKYIIENRDQFDIYEPDPVAWKRIEKKIRLKSGINWRMVLIRAAGVAVIISLSFLASEFIHRLRDNRILTDRVGRKSKEVVIPELKEAEAYYAAMVNEKLAQMKDLISDHPDIEEELLADFSELDSIYLELKNDLKDNIANQEVINAIIENYKLKIDILEDMLMELNPDRNVNRPKNEDYDL